MGNVSIRGGQIGVPQLTLNDAIVDPLVSKMKGRCVPALMGMRPLTYTNPFSRPSENAPDVTGIDFAASPGSEYKLVDVPPPYELSQAYLDFFPYPDHPTLAALAALDC